MSEVAPSQAPTPVLGGAPLSESQGAPAQTDVTPTPTPQEDPKFAAKFAAITRKEREIFQKEQALKLKEEKYSKYESLESLRAQDPYKYAKEVGLDLDQLILGATKDGQPETAEDRLARLEKMIADKEEAEAKAKADREAADKEAQQKKEIDHVRNTIHDRIKADPERYELINLEEAFDHVFDVAVKRYQDAPQSFTTLETAIDEAAEIVEKWIETRALKFQQSKKLGLGKAEQKAEPNALAAISKPEASVSEAPTLTASQTARTSNHEAAPANETREEAIARIAAQYEPLLKQGKSK